MSTPLSPTVIWFLAGVVLCALELFVPTAFVEFTMGISAFLVALASQFIPQLSLQVLLWTVLSAAMIYVSRRFVPSPKTAAKFDATEAEVITEILPGAVGRVLYEGNSWQAQCEDSHAAIAPKQKVYVVGRRGTTLIVVPENLLRA